MGLMSLIRSAVLISICSAVDASAASLQIFPVNIEVKAPASAAILTLRNLDDHVAATQIRVFRWRQRGGKDALEPTQSVVASPPAANLKPDTDYTVRIVRVDRSPIAGEESYRLLVDQIPDSAQLKAGAVNLAIRYSIPVFFSNSPQAAKVSWSITEKAGHIQLMAINSGQQRLKITNLTLTNSRGQVLNFGNGLLGYVLGGGSQEFNSHVLPASYASGGKFLIRFDTDNGPLEVTVAGQNAN